MSLNKKRRSDYYDYPEHASRQMDPYYPNDCENWPLIGSNEGSVKYSSWKRFIAKYPFNAKLLIHLFGERDAIECHRSMVVVSELKAASLCSFFSAQRFEKSRIQSMGDC